MGLLGRLFGLGVPQDPPEASSVAREVPSQPNVFVAQVQRMTLDGEPIGDLWDLVPLYQAAEEHYRNCYSTSEGCGQRHFIRLIVEHQQFPWSNTKSYVYLDEIRNGVWSVFVLTRETTGMFMMDPRLGDRWGELQLAEGGDTKLVVNNRPAPDHYYNN